MIGLSSQRLRSGVRALSRLSCVLVPIAVVAVATMFAWVGFGLIFNYTHSVPFGIYREIADPASTPHNPAPYVFFCPDVRWQSMKGQLTYEAWAGKAAAAEEAMAVAAKAAASGN